MPDEEPTFAEQMVEKLESLLLANPGASTITIDGVTTSFVDVEARLNRYRAEVARAQSTRNRFNSFNLGGSVPL